MKDEITKTLQTGPMPADSSGDQLPSGLVATMWMCLLASVDKQHLEEIGDCNMAVAFDLGIAVQVAEEEVIPLPDLMVEVFEFYNEKLELTLPSKVMAKQVAESYYHAQVAQKQLH
ncbi:hypothetical protein [uncultured Ferrimonas sp.]|uniref:hypothetical protein n=1 Tax=uncultured Ferrimonas sp. TaxID=432640 RepID=UPI002621574C|nr:hypothetical protein [uncultured Ferrimonas sp.]